MIFHVSVTEIFVLFSGLENVDQNLRQKFLTPFYCKTVSPRANMDNDIFVELDMVY